MRLRRLLKGGFSFFSQEGWKNFRWGASHMQYAILDALEGALNGKPKCARGVKRYSSGVKRFLKGVKEIRPCLLQLDDNKFAVAACCQQA